MSDNKIHKLMASVILIEAILSELDDRHYLSEQTVYTPIGVKQ